jgi:hypothetical protein
MSNNFLAMKLSKGFVLIFVALFLLGLVVWALSDDLTTKLRIERSYKSIKLPPSFKLVRSEWFPKDIDNGFSTMVYKYTSNDDVVKIDQEFNDTLKKNGFDTKSAGAEANYTNCSKKLSITRYIDMDNPTHSQPHFLNVVLAGVC